MKNYYYRIINYYYLYYYTMYTLHYTLHIVHCIFYDEFSTMYNEQCMVIIACYTTIYS